MSYAPPRNLPVQNSGSNNFWGFRIVTTSLFLPPPVRLFFYLSPSLRPPFRSSIYWKTTSHNTTTFSHSCEAANVEIVENRASRFISKPERRRHRWLPPRHPIKLASNCTRHIIIYHNAAACLYYVYYFIIHRQRRRRNISKEKQEQQLQLPRPYAHTFLRVPNAPVRI